MEVGEGVDATPPPSPSLYVRGLKQKMANRYLIQVPLRFLLLCLGCL